MRTLDSATGLNTACCSAVRLVIVISIRSLSALKISVLVCIEMPQT